MGGVELVSPCRLGAFDASVEVGAFGRQDAKFEAVVAAGLFEGRHELASAVDLDAAHGERRFGDELFEQRGGAVCAGAGGDAAERPFGDGIVGGEVLDRLAGPDVDEEGVDLDEFAGRLGLAALGQPARVALPGGESDAPAFRTPRSFKP